MEPDRDAQIARSLFRESNDAFFLFDPATDRVLDLNPAARRLTGFDKRSALALSVGNLFESIDGTSMTRLVAACHETTFFHSREEYALRKKVGGSIPVNLSVSRVHTTPEPLGLIVARDISERRRAQETLERFFRFSPDLFCVFDRDFRLLTVNPAWEHCLGYDSEELLAMAPFQAIHPDDLESSRAAVASLSKGDVSGFENRVRGKDGGYRRLSWSVALVEGRAFAVARDVTELRHAEELRLAKEAAEAAGRAKGQFLANMSHELRTPMAAILGLIEVFLNDPGLPPLPADRVEDLHSIRRNGDHLLRIIGDILDFSKIDAGKLAIRLAPADPSAVVSEVLEMMRPSAVAKGLALEHDFATPLPATILTDVSRLRQALINLVANAVKFTDDGSVRVRVSLEADAPGGPALQFAVMDTGVGMTEVALAGLFQPFHQAESGDGRRRGGTGLGLAISRRLAEMLGGTIAVESEPGWGSTFTLTVATGPLDGVALVDPRELAPTAKPPPRAVVAPPPTTAGGHAVRRILLAEDNADNRRAATLRLRQAGLEVTGVPDGQQARDAALASMVDGRPFDVILMDMQMPVLDGFEATRLLRAEGYDRPIIALTAFAMPEDREECLRFGCDDHVSKPIDWGHLLELIETRGG